MKEFLASKKTLAMITGIVATITSTYFLKDNPEMAQDIALKITGMASALILGQGAADAFGGDGYHKKKKPKKK